jgi:hypothetical protein
MVAVRVSPDLRRAIVAAPVYFDSQPKPRAPRDVLNDQCIRFRHWGESVYKWELDKGHESLAIAVHGSLLLDELDLVIQAALDGAGLAWVAEDRITEHLATGAWCACWRIGVRHSRVLSVLSKSRAATGGFSRRSSTRYDFRRARGVSDSQTSRSDTIPAPGLFERARDLLKANQIPNRTDVKEGFALHCSRSLASD